MKITKSDIWFAVALMLLGIIMGIQIRSNSTRSQMLSAAAKQVDYYQNLIKEEVKKSKKYKREIRRYERENKELYEAFAYLDKEGAFSELNEQLKKALKFAGMNDVKGPGLILTIDDADIPPEERAGMDASDFVIHDMDVLRFVNELKKGGAQAISINDERIISTSEQVCAGPTVMINGRKYVTPYVIKCIGDPNILRQSIESSLVYTEFKEYGLSVNIEVSDEISIEGYLIKKNEGAKTNEKMDE